MTSRADRRFRPGLHPHDLEPRSLMAAPVTATLPDQTPDNIDAIDAAFEEEVAVDTVEMAPVHMDSMSADDKQQIIDQINAKYSTTLAKLPNP